MMKICSKCGTRKPLNDFHLRKASGDGHQSRCKICINEYQNERLYVNGKLKADYNRDLNYVTRRAITRHGLTAEQFDAVLETQGGTCRLCDSTSYLCVDHDRSCCPGPWSCGTCIRGILCKKHNTALGGFGDNSSLLRDAADYLDEFSLGTTESIKNTGSNRGRKAIMGVR